MTHPTLPHRHERRTRRGGGFTLIELMVVISIIVLLLAVAVPAFRYITGARSVDSAQNLVAAMLNRARAEAVRTKQRVGVAFYRDPKNDRTVMALVGEASTTRQASVEPPGMEQYRAWQVSTALQTVSYNVGDVVIRSSNSPAGPDNKKLVRMFTCREAIADSQPGNAPPEPGASTPWVDTNTWWGQVEGSDLDVFTTVDYQLLPVGIGVQLVNDPRGAVSADRYMRTGIVLFDGTGRLTVEPYAIDSTSNLGQLMELSTDLVNGSGDPFMYTQLGVVLYELEPFRGVAGTTDGDWLTRGYTTAAGQPTSVTNELATEEPWLDKNGLVLLVDRASGSLSRGE